MIVTDNEIEVTEQMMFNAGLSRLMVTGQIGIPFSETEPKPVEWKQLSDLEEKDFDKIEAFFKTKTAPQN